MAGALQGLAVGLPAVAQFLPQQLADRVRADRVAHRTQFVRELGVTLGNPQQRPHGIAKGDRQGLPARPGGADPPGASDPCPAGACDRCRHDGPGPAARPVDPDRPAPARGGCGPSQWPAPRRRGRRRQPRALRPRPSGADRVHRVARARSLGHPRSDLQWRRLVLQLPLYCRYGPLLGESGRGGASLSVAVWSGSLVAWERELVALKERIGPVFGRAETRATAGAFLDGLLSGVARKTGWLLAEQAGLERPYRMQSLLGRSHWDADALRDCVRADVIEVLGDRDGVLVVDETGFLKKGEHSVGVARQYSGTADRKLSGRRVPGLCQS